MHKLIFIALLIFAGCSDDKRNKKADVLESGRAFIEASLKGDYDDAKEYLLTDSINLDYFDKLVAFYKKTSSEDKEGYKNANIIIAPNGIENIADSVAIIHYSNTYKNTPSKIKMVRINGEWLVDFKYTFSGNL